MHAATIPGEAFLRALPEPLMIGVSGGIDSMALLHALVKVGRRPIVLHFDHGWRAESGVDAARVRERARAAGLKYAGAKMRAAEWRTEAAARSARYAFFSRTARKLGVRDLVLAHHADDQVETFLLQLLRGSGAAGRGMDPVAEREGLVLHRPWLGVWKGDIRRYARAERLAWREDATNRDTRHRRNLVRGRLLPYLRKQFSKGAPENLWRAAEIARAESGWLDALCADEAAGAELSVKALREGPLARQRRTILRWLQGRGIADISFADVEAVRGLVENRVPAKINLSGGRHARRRMGKIFVE